MIYHVRELIEKLGSLASPSVSEPSGANRDETICITTSLLTHHAARLYCSIFELRGLPGAKPTNIWLHLRVILVRGTKLQRDHAATDGTHNALRIRQAVTLINLELSKEDEANVGKDEREVRREDQDKINKFSKLHQRETALEDELKTKAVWETLFVFSNVDLTDESCRRTRKIWRNCQMNWS